MTGTSALPQRDQPPVASSRLWAGVVIAPAAWSVSELLGYWLAARACDRGSASTAANAGVVQDVLAVVLGLVAVTGLVIAVGNWRRVRESSGSTGGPAAWGRAEFMALGGTVASALFVLGIILFALPPLLVNACDQVR